MSLIIKTLPNRYTASICVLVPFGSAQEQKQQRGVAHIIEHILPTAYTTALDSLGVSTYFKTTQEYTSFQFTFDSTRRQEITKVIANIFNTNNITEEVLLREKEVIIEEIAYVQDEVSFGEMVSEFVLGDNVLGNDPLGDAKQDNALKNIDSRLLKQVYNEEYNRDTMILAYVGPEEKSVVLQDSFISSFNSGEVLDNKRIFFQIEGTDEVKLLCKNSNTSEVSLVYAYKTEMFIREVHAEFFATLLNLAFEKSIRDDNRMSYDAAVYITQLSGVALIELRFSTTANSNESIAVLKDFLKRFEISDEYFNTTKDILITSVKMTLDSVTNLAVYLAVQNIYETNITPEKEIEILRDISKEHIQDMSDAVLKSNNYRLFYS